MEGGWFLRRFSRFGPTQRPRAVLHPADSVPQSWRRTSGLRSEPVSQSARLLHRRVGLGQIPWWRSDRKRRGRVRLKLESLDAEFTARDGQERRELHEFATDQDGSAGKWFCRRHRAWRSRLCFRRIGRKHFHGEQRHRQHSAAVVFSLARDHARQCDSNLRRVGNHD